MRQLVHRHPPGPRCAASTSVLTAAGLAFALALALAFALGLAPAADAGAAPAWVPLEPEGGQIESLAPAPGGVVYAGAFWGAGVSRSRDGGRHWHPANRGLPQGAVTALAVVARHPEIVYAGNQFGPYVSSDGGESWLPALAGFQIGAQAAVRVMAVTAEGAAVYALSSTGALHKARPPERSWTRVAFPALASSLTADPLQPSTLYVGASGGLYRTRDGGETWSLLGSGTLPSDPVMALDPETPGSLYAFGGSSPTLFHSMDDGATWEPHPVPLPAGSSEGSLAAEPGGKVLLAPRSTLNLATALLESADGGATWTTPAGGPPDFIQALVAAPGESGTVYAGGGRGFWLSTDAGDRWRASSRGLHAQLLTGVSLGTDSCCCSAALDPGAGAFRRPAPVRDGAVLRRPRRAYRSPGKTESGG